MTANTTDAGSARILLFLKAPRPGEVKTRLAEAVGAERACAVYQTIAERPVRRWPGSMTPEIHYSPATAEPEMRAWLGDRVRLVPQTRGGLGERLEHAVARAFADGAASVICIGGDCPRLGERHIREAIALLDAGNDPVLGPCEDGGYYLIGLAAPHVELFRDIPWSTPDTLDATVERARALGLHPAFLETLYDVDTVEDLERATAEGIFP